MKLSDLLHGLDHHVVTGQADDVDITGGVVFDSRAVTPGSLFAAVAGRHVDGHRFLAQAREAGAAAALVERDVEAPAGLCVVKVANTRQATAHAASRYFGEPGRDMQVIAITGTNGKTSVAYMLDTILTAAGRRVGVIGTGGPRLAGEAVPVKTTTTTTPEAADLQAILRYMADQNATTVVMEASSTALMQHRTDAAAIDIGIFTNLTPDHLEDHGTMQAYQAAKMRLFDGQCALAVTNADDPVSATVQALMPNATVTFSAAGQPADFTATDIQVSATGTTFTLLHSGNQLGVQIPIPGHFAVANALAAIAAAAAAGIDTQAAIGALAALPQIPGRFETYRARSGAVVIVDYAHSEDSLDKILHTIKTFATARIITVFGCGGDRDTTKRAPMGRVAGQLSDQVVITTDNPRSEDPESILDQIQSGLAATGTPYERIPDRRVAIGHALHVARDGDVVLLAGKGAETTQLVAGNHLPFVDMAVVKEHDHTH